MLRCIRCFTLIELLLTVSIIAILAGLVIPAAGRSMRYARGVKCAAVLRQLGVAESAYNDRSDGFMLPAQANELRWYHLLAEDVAPLCRRRSRNPAAAMSPAVPFCPENPQEEGRPIAIGSLRAFTPWDASGAVVSDLGGYGRWLFYGGAWQASYVIYRPQRVARLRNPSRKISLLDGYSSLLYSDAMFDNPPASGATAWTRHRENAIQVLSGDCHVDTLARCRMSGPDGTATVRISRFEP